MNNFDNPYLRYLQAEADLKVLVEVLTKWGQHPDTIDPDLMGSRVYLNTADINEIAKLILEAGFRLG